MNNKVYIYCILISILMSCTKSELTVDKLKGNPHEEFEMMVPIKIDNIGVFIPTQGNYRAVVSFVVAQEYLTLIEGRPYQFVLYRDGTQRATTTSNNDYFNDGVVYQQTYSYSISMRFYDDGSETNKSESVSVYITGT